MNQREVEMEKESAIIKPPHITFISGDLSGKEVIHKTKKIKELDGLFENIEAFQKMDGEQIAYEVDAYFPIPNGTEGGLFFGITHLNPGLVGDEYFMTHGHYHEVENRGEFYWGIEGEGVLLLMDKAGETRGEFMVPGSLHYIPGFTAHRVVNTSDTILRFGACWPADAGYNYGSINTKGFSKRVKNRNGSPQLI